MDHKNEETVIEAMPIAKSTQMEVKESAGMRILNLLPLRRPEQGEECSNHPLRLYHIDPTAIVTLGPHNPRLLGRNPPQASLHLVVHQGRQARC